MRVKWAHAEADQVGCNSDLAFAGALPGVRRSRDYASAAGRGHDLAGQVRGVWVVGEIQSGAIGGGVMTDPKVSPVSALVQRLLEAGRGVLAFYPPTRNPHLDTEAWKLAEASLRRAVKEAEEVEAAAALRGGGSSPELEQLRQERDELRRAIHPKADATWTHTMFCRLAEAHRSDSEAIDAAEAGGGSSPTGETPGNPLNCDQHNIAQILIERFAGGDPGSGLTLNCHEAHTLIALLTAGPSSHGTPPTRVTGLNGVPGTIRAASSPATGAPGQVDYTAVRAALAFRRWVKTPDISPDEDLIEAMAALVEQHLNSEPDEETAVPSSSPAPSQIGRWLLCPHCLYRWDSGELGIGDWTACPRCHGSFSFVGPRLIAPPSPAPSGRRHEDDER